MFGANWRPLCLWPRAQATIATTVPTVWTGTCHRDRTIWIAPSHHQRLARRYKTVEAVPRGKDRSEGRKLPQEPSPSGISGRRRGFAEGCAPIISSPGRETLLAWPIRSISRTLKLKSTRAVGIRSDRARPLRRLGSHRCDAHVLRTSATTPILLLRQLQVDVEKSCIDGLPCRETTLPAGGRVLFGGSCRRQVGEASGPGEVECSKVINGKAKVQEMGAVGFIYRW